MKKLLLTLFLSLSLICSLNAEQNEKIFPDRGIVSFLGLDDTSSPTIMKDGRAADIQNITLDTAGQAKKRYGYSYAIGLNTASDDLFGAVTSLYELYKSNGTRTKIATCDDKVFTWTVGSKTDITGSLTFLKGDHVQFVWTTALDYAIGTNDHNLPIKTGGTTATALSFTGLTNPVTAARTVVWWKNYLIFGNTIEGGVRNRTRITWSNVGKIETWSDSDYIDIDAIGGQQIEGFGILYDNLYVFLTDSIYKVSLVGGDELFVVTKVSDKVGAIAKNSIRNISVGGKEGLIFLSRDSTVNFLDGVSVQEISVLIHGIMSDLDASRLPYAVAEVDTFNSHYYLSVTDGTDTISPTSNNLVLDFFYEIGEWSKITQIDANAMCIANDSSSVPQIYFGNYDSFVYQMNDTDLYSDVLGATGTVSITQGRDNINADFVTGLNIVYDDNLSSYTILLMHCEGVNGTNTFIDEANKPITANGNVQIDTDYKKFGSSSALFDGTGDYLTLADSADFYFNADFTIDFWMRANNITSSGIIFMQATDGDNYLLFREIGDELQFLVLAANATAVEVLTTTDVLTTNTWMHIAVVRYGNIYTIYKDGVAVGTSTDTDAPANYTGSLFIGSRYNQVLYYDGWIDEIRFSKGIARWTADFTPPTSAYTNSDIVDRFLGATITFTSGTGIGEERVIGDVTSSGLIVTAATTATGNTVYSIGAINSYYVTKWNDFGNASRRKNFKDLYLWTEKQSSESIDVFWATDESTTIQSTTMNLDDGEELGGTSIVTGTAVTWEGTQTNFANEPLNVSGRFLKLRFGEDDVDGKMDLFGYAVLGTDLDYK